MLTSSEQTNEISAALASAQAEMQPAPKDSVNPHFKSRYADLASCREAAKPHLAKHGLGVIQTIHTDLERDAVGVTTRLTHKSGQWYEAVTWCKPRDLSPQQVGSAATYLRRYGFSAITGLVSEEDDDGNSSQGYQPKAKPAQSAPAKSQPGIYDGSPDQQKKILEILAKNGVPQEDYDYIHDRMLGKPSTHLAVILKEYAHA
jgi:hypothetical protein